ncbi:MAG: fumarylacetoacetate hydrolase family protein [Clostridia bacterium]|nr:fumarylacetoacetate hydrolase family protein [Clostridia bacterium]
MKFCKFYTNPEKTETKWGIVEGDVVKTLAKAPYDEVLPDGGSVKLSDVVLTCPCDATKIVAIGRNYYEHVLEFNNEVPKEPLIFLKPTTALTDPDGSVEKPDFTNRFDYEGEIAVVIGKKAKNVKKEEALDYILGYTCLNDITARDIQYADSQWTRGKGLDGSAPVGPFVTSGLQHNKIGIQTYLNGKKVQDGNTELMMWDIPSLIEYVTRYITLLPGDVFTCGTPVNVGPMVPGDVVEIVGEGIGTLRTTIV